MATRQNRVKEILAQYDQGRPDFEEMAANASQLISGFVRESGVVLHSSDSRVKERSSLEGKLRRPGKNYQTLFDVTDIVGIRLTTYFSTDVDRVAEIVEREFAIDLGNSADKRVQDDPNRFGYQSLHYVVEYNPQRCALSEYRRFSGHKFEIQIRSILQHAWAEIEHDLGYKSPTGIPTDVRRRFARIAGLLELADVEFSGIRAQLESYEASLPQLLAKDPSVELDQAVLQLLVETDPALKALDVAVCTVAGAEIGPTTTEQIDSSLKKLKFFGINDVSSLKSTAQANLEPVRKFAAYWLENNYESLSAGIGLFYLGYVLASREPHQKIVEYLEKSNIDASQNRESLAREIGAFNDE